MVSHMRSILIGHPHPVSEEGLTRVLQESGDVSVHHAATTHELVEVVEAELPNMVIVHFSMLGPDMDTIHRLLKGRDPTIVVLIDPDDKGSVAASTVQAGAKGCLCTGDQPHLFMASLRLVLEGGEVISPASSAVVSERLLAGTEERSWMDLSERERQLAIPVAKGASNKEIADEFTISDHTVKIHLRNILAKLNLRNRQQIAAYIGQFGLLEDISLRDQ